MLAIRNGHPEVVRELLTAGAIVPPPGITQDPVMLSVLYPQPLYGFPPQFMGQMGMPPQEFYAVVLATLERTGASQFIQDVVPRSTLQHL